MIRRQSQDTVYIYNIMHYSTNNAFVGIHGCDHVERGRDTLALVPSRRFERVVISEVDFDLELLP
jgi:hypothetical protein